MWTIRGPLCRHESPIDGSTIDAGIGALTVGGFYDILTLEPAMVSTPRKPLPNGISWRPASAEDATTIRRVQVDTWRNAYRGIVPDDYLESMSYEPPDWILRAATDGRHMLVAVEHDGERGEDVVGFVTFGPSRRDASRGECEVYAMYVSANSQRRGIGSMLFDESLRIAATDGYNLLLVCVLSENPYRAFYIGLGGKEIGRAHTSIGGRHVEQTLFQFRLDPP